MPSTRLRVVYRSHGGENRKARPGYYSKRLALASFVAALSAVRDRADALFLNDGPIPADRLALMAPAGEVRAVRGGSNRRSFRAAVALAARRRPGPHDLVWFAEDDYLYAPDALARLLAAADRIGDADYFSLYGRLALDPASPRAATRFRSPDGAAAAPEAVDLDGTRWYRAASTTSTFGVRGHVLARDARLLRTMPFTGGAWDHATCLAVQGRAPYTWEEVRTDLLPAGPDRPRAVLRGLARGAAVVRSRRRPGLRRQLWAADPEPVTHLEEDGLAPGTDWAALADQVR